VRTAKIFEIKHFAVHDGDGVRTTVFFKGCPLKCIWCHNPESINMEKQLAYFAHKCVNCGMCKDACEANKFLDGVHIFERKNCMVCGKCETVCPREAFKIYGDEVSVDAIVEELLLDKPFYDNSKGGITLSGGECLLQADACAEILRKCKNEGISTAVDTCGFIPKESLDKVIPYTDVFLYDMKAIDSTVHKKCTGRPNEMILDNLKYLDSKGCKIEIRIPFVPGHNDGEIDGMAKFISQLKNVTKVSLLPYHDYARSKYASLDTKDTLPLTLPDEEQLSKAREMLNNCW